MHDRVAVEIDVSMLDAARLSWASGSADQVVGVTPSTITLGGALEAACWFANEPDAGQRLSSWLAKSDALSLAHRALSSTAELPVPDLHSAPHMELCRCPSRSELESDDEDWFYVCDRFRRSLKEHLGLPPRTTNGLTAALAEMVDNVVSHSGMGDAPNGVVAYHVTDQYLAFGVADLGCGVLASLHENPAHRGITTDAAGLDAAIRHGASSRPGATGTGFRSLLDALADMEGVWTFRSGAARLNIDGRGRGDRACVLGSSAKLQGFQLSVTARPTESCW